MGDTRWVARVEERERWQQHFGLTMLPHWTDADASGAMDHRWSQNTDGRYVPNTARCVTLRALTTTSCCWEGEEAWSLKLAGWLEEQTFPSAPDGILTGPLVENQKLFNSERCANITIPTTHPFYTTFIPLGHIHTLSRCMSFYRLQLQ